MGRQARGPSPTRGGGRSDRFNLAGAPNAPIGDVIKETFHISGRVEADPRLAEHAPVIIGSHDALTKAVAARNVAGIGYQKGLTLRAAARVKLEGAVVRYGLKVAAACTGRTADEYQRLFPKAPQSFATLSERDLPEAAVVLDARIGDAKTDKESARAGAPILAASKPYQAAGEAAKVVELKVSEAQRPCRRPSSPALRATATFAACSPRRFPARAR